MRSPRFRSSARCRDVGSWVEAPVQPAVVAVHRSRAWRHGPSLFTSARADRVAGPAISDGLVGASLGSDGGGPILPGAYTQAGLASAAMPGDLVSDERVARRALVLATLAVVVAMAIGLAAFRFGPAPEMDAASRDAGAATAAAAESGAAGPATLSAPAARGVPSRATDLVARGRPLYLATCAACHGATGQGQVGPALNATAEPGRLSDAHVTEMVTRGSLRMPPVGSAWSDQDVAAVGAYLRTLRTP